MTNTTRSSAQALDDLVRAADLYHEQHIRTLRALQDGLNVRYRDTISSFSPSLGATNGPVFASESLSPYPVLRRPRASTLDSTVERPSLSNSPSGNSRPVITQDDDINFIPLLDSNLLSASTTRRVEEYSFNIVKNPLGTITFSDQDLLRHLHSTDFSDKLTSLFQEVVKRRPDIDFALSFHDFAAYERESYNSSTFEVYEITQDCRLSKLSMDADVEDQFSVKYTGSGPYETSTDVVDAPTVWETIRTVNPSGQSVGRITYVF